jgi:uncharacterized protein YceH (UPF0502 family)
MSPGGTRSGTVDRPLARDDAFARATRAQQLAIKLEERVEALERKIAELEKRERVA